MDFVLPPKPEPPKKPWAKIYREYERKYVYVGLSDEAVAAYKAEFAKHEEAVRAWREARVVALKAAVEMLGSAGFPTSRNWQETVRGKPKFLSQTLTDALSPFLPGIASASCYTSDEETWLREAVTREREAKEKADAAGKRDRAVAFLLARGKTYGADFTADSALDVARDIVCEEKIAEAKAAGGPISFSGDDNCEGCDGWTPGDHRCACGNRRVSWSSDGDFENLYIYAEAH